MNNNTFNINRFSLLCKKQFSEISKALALELATLLGVLIVIFFLNGKYGGPYLQTSQWNLYAIIFIFTGIYYSKIFKKLRSDSQGLFEITLPASRFEKLLFALLLSAVIFPLLFSIVFFASNYAAYYLFSGINGFEMELLTFNLLPSSMPFSAALTIMLLFQSIFMLGYIWFKKYPILKTTIALICLFVVVVTSFELISKIWTIPHGHDLSFAVQTILKIFPFDWLIYATIVYMWITSYFRLSEKEI